MTGVQTCALPISARCAVLLRTADQYDMWKNRVADARARMCSSPPTTSAKLPSSEWVSKCWTILTASLHDDVYRKVNHVQRGCIKSLLDEVAHTPQGRLACTSVVTAISPMVRMLRSAVWFIHWA